MYSEEEYVDNFEWVASGVSSNFNLYDLLLIYFQHCDQYKEEIDAVDVMLELSGYEKFAQKVIGVLDICKNGKYLSIKLRFGGSYADYNDNEIVLNTIEDVLKLIKEFLSDEEMK